MTTEMHSTIEQFELPHPTRENVFQIRIAMPANLPQNTMQVPVLFVLDGDLNFGIAAELARFRAFAGMPQPCMVVGIGYGAAFPDFIRWRSSDLTLPLGASAAQAMKAALRGMEGPFGGAHAVLDFVTSVLQPEILRRYAIAAPNNQILFGHSLGGLFVAYTLLKRPGAFASYIAASPALFWDDFAVLTCLSGFSDRLQTLPSPPRVLITVASREGEMPAEFPPELGITREEYEPIHAYARMLPASMEFAERLRMSGLHQVEHFVFQAEEHMTVVPAALMRAFSFALRPPCPAPGEKTIVTTHQVGK